MVTSNTYQIIDATGWRVAEISFHRAFAEHLHVDYLEEICKLFSAAGYAPVSEYQLSEFGQLIAD
jgi:DNA-binding FadR family transcriptional regulator